jgi:predicted kinase
MDYTDGKTLLSILKPKKGDAPSFGEIPFDNIIFEALKSSLNVGPSSEPKVLILCGPPGCGKSTVKTNLLTQFSIDNYINIDPDEIRTILMANGVTFPADKTTMAGITNAFNKRISDEAQKQHLNIVFDTTGQNFRAVSDLLYTSRQLGYKSYFSIIWASLETCRRRIEGRNQYLRESSSGRIELPLEVAEGIYNGFVQPKGTASMFLLDYPVRANEVFLYNNNTDGTEPQLLYHKVGDSVEFSTNFPGFYNMNLSDSDPYISKSSGGGKRRRRTKKRRSNKRRRRTYKRK